MTTPAQRLVLEAGAVASNYRSEAYRKASAREVAKISLDQLTQGGPGAGHLLLAIREAVTALALASTSEGREQIAAALRALVFAARAEPPVILRKVPGTALSRCPAADAPRMYWIDR
jgi:hypothetical protein